MKMIAINCSSSDQNIKVLQEIIRKEWILKEVTMCYNPSIGLPVDCSPNDYPFKAVFGTAKGEIVVAIYTLTVGYGGSGPFDFARILDFLEVQYDENDIFSKRREDIDGYIRLKYLG